MKELLERLHRSGMALNPPATAEELGLLEESWQVKLSDEVSTLYLDHDGQPYVYEANWPFRLLSTEEVCEVREEFELEENMLDILPELLGDFVPLWSNEQGDCLLWHARGQRRGLISWWDHETALSPKPCFASVPDLYAALSDAQAQGTSQLQHGSVAGHPALEGAYQEVADAFTQVRAPAWREYWAAQMIPLCPKSRLSELVPLLSLRGEEEYHLEFSLLAVAAARRLLAELGQAAHPAIE